MSRMEQQKEVPSSPKSADLCVGHPRVCRMDCQNGSVLRNKQGEAGRPCRKEQKRSIWKTDGFHTPHPKYCRITRIEKSLYGFASPLRPMPCKRAAYCLRTSCVMGCSSPNVRLYIM